MFESNTRSRNTGAGDGPRNRRSKSRFRCAPRGANDISEPTRDHGLIVGSDIEIVDGASAITPADRATQDRRFRMESTGSGATVERYVLNSGEDEGGREIGGDRGEPEREK